MKIISGNLKGENIQFNCNCCNCTYEIESREDFIIRWFFKPLRNGAHDWNTEIPEYSVVCPVCGRDTYIGFDEADYDGRFLPNCYNEIIMSRPDWNSRYKVEPRVRGKVSSI